MKIWLIEYLQQSIYKFIEYTYRDICYKKMRSYYLQHFSSYFFQLDMGKVWDEIKANVSSDRMLPLLIGVR